MSLEYLDPETITKALSIAAAVATTAYKLKDVKPRRRATLKADIELLGIAKAQGIESAELGNTSTRSSARSTPRPTANGSPAGSRLPRSVWSGSPGSWHGRCTCLGTGSPHGRF